MNIWIMRTITSHLSSIFLLGFLLFNTSDKVQACSTSLNPPHGIVQSAEVIVRATAEEFIENQGVKFKVSEVVKGTNVPTTLLIKGSLSENDEFNPRPVPYWHVRRSGSAPCFAYKYKKGAEFLLLLKNIKGELTPYWRALAATNEQLRSVDDEWIKWVKEHLKWLETATELQRLELTFELLKKQHFNTNAELLWGYHFIDANEEKLQKLAKHLESLGYTIVKISKSENKADLGESELRVEKIEKHSPITMNRRNEEFKGLANTFGIRKYNQGSIRRVK